MPPPDVGADPELILREMDVARRSGLRYMPAAPLVFVLLHFGYGLGSLKGVLTFWILRRKGRAEDHPLSR